MPDPAATRPSESLFKDLGPAEVVVNETRYVREATLFAAMERLDALHADVEAARLCLVDVAAVCSQQEAVEAALTRAGVPLDETIARLS